MLFFVTFRSTTLPCAIPYLLIFLLVYYVYFVCHRQEGRDLGPKICKGCIQQLDNSHMPGSRVGGRGSSCWLLPTVADLSAGPRWVSRNAFVCRMAPVFLAPRPCRQSSPPLPTLPSTLQALGLSRLFKPVLYELRCMHRICQ